MCVMRRLPVVRCVLCLMSLCRRRRCRRLMCDVALLHGTRQSHEIWQSGLRVHTRCLAHSELLPRPGTARHLKGHNGICNAMNFIWCVVCTDSNKVPRYFPCCWTEQVIKQTIMLPEICDNTTLKCMLTTNSDNGHKIFKFQLKLQWEGSKI